MSNPEVLIGLIQAGEFTLWTSDWPGGYIELGISFTDPKGKDLYGGFELGFSDYKYNGAYIRGFDYSESICDFSQVNPTGKQIWVQPQSVILSCITKDAPNWTRPLCKSITWLDLVAPERIFEES